MLYGPEEAFVIEGGSTNGSFLNEVKMEADTKTSIKSRDKLRFGKLLEFEFYFPGDLWDDLSHFRNSVQGDSPA